MNPFFSIIVPIYNREDTLKKCLDSVIMQNVSKEIILVDDCSTDASSKIIHNYKSRYDDVRVVTHQENKGSGGTRNTGLLYVKGSYMLFLDSDDWYEDGALSKLKSAIEKNKRPDIIVFSFNRVSDNNKIIGGASKNLESTNDSLVGRGIFESFLNGIINPSPWNKAYKREFWYQHNFRFVENMPHDDFALMPYICRKAQSAVILSERLYNYLEHSNNITNSISDYKIECSTRSVEKMREYFGSDGDIIDVTEDDLNRIAYKHYYYGFRTRRQLCSDKQIMTWINYILRYNYLYKVSSDFIKNYDRARKLFALFVYEMDKRNLNIEIFSNYSKIESKQLLNEIENEMIKMEKKKNKFSFHKYFKSSMFNRTL